MSTNSSSTTSPLRCPVLQTNVSLSSDHEDGAQFLWIPVVPIVVVILISVISNVLMLYALYRTPHLRTVQNIFTVNLGVTDLCTALFVLPLWILTLVSGMPQLLCTLVGMVTVVLQCVSVATLACISLDRHLSICYALEYPSEITPRRVWYVVGYVWVQGVVLALVGWGGYRVGPVKVPVCLPDWSHSTTYSVVMLLVALVAPFLLMVYSYSRIVQVRNFTLLSLLFYFWFL